MMVYKSLQSSSFNFLDASHQKAVVLMLEDKLTDEENAKSVNRYEVELGEIVGVLEFKHSPS